MGRAGEIRLSGVHWEWIGSLGPNRSWRIKDVVGGWSQRQGRVTAMLKNRIAPRTLRAHERKGFFPIDLVRFDFCMLFPELRSRIKVNIRTRDIEGFEYGPGADDQWLMYLNSSFFCGTKRS